MPAKVRHAALPIPPAFFTVEETAAKLRLSKRTVYSLVGKRVLRSHRMAGTDAVRISERDLFEYVERSRVGKR